MFDLSCLQLWRNRRTSPGKIQKKQCNLQVLLSTFFRFFHILYRKVSTRAPAIMLKTNLPRRSKTGKSPINMKKHCNLHTIGDGGKPDSTRNGKRRSFESSVYCFTHALLVYFPLLLLAFVNVSPLFSHVILLFVNKVPYSSSPLPFFALAL